MEKPKTNYQWSDILIDRPPLNVPVLVKLERKMTRSEFAVAIYFEETAIISGKFHHDCPKVTHWTSIEFKAFST